MKKALVLATAGVLALLCCSCGQPSTNISTSGTETGNEEQSKDITIDGIEAAIQVYDPSFSFGDDKPIFVMIGASDGWMGYSPEGNVIKVYQYENDDAYNQALEEYSSTIGDWPKNGNFVLETSDPNAILAFTSYDGNIDNVKAPEQKQDASLAIGEETELGDWTISVTGFEFAPQIDDSTGYMYFAPDSEGSQYGIVSVSVTNNGTEAGTFLPSYPISGDVAATMFYNTDYEYSSTHLLGYENELHDAFLNPLSSISGNIVFELPDAVVNGTEPISIVFTDGSDSVEFSLR